MRLRWAGHVAFMIQLKMHKNLARKSDAKGRLESPTQTGCNTKILKMTDILDTVPVFFKP
jgi:hypothetical protein